MGPLLCRVSDLPSSAPPFPLSADKKSINLFSYNQLGVLRQALGESAAFKTIPFIPCRPHLLNFLKALTDPGMEAQSEGCDPSYSDG